LFYQETVYWGLLKVCKKGSGNRHFSPWGNLQAASFTEDFERWMKKDSGNGVPLRQLCEENLEGGLLYWGL
jgi:hypothetical protein